MTTLTVNAEFYLISIRVSCVLSLSCSLTAFYTADQSTEWPNKPFFSTFETLLRQFLVTNDTKHTFKHEIGAASDRTGGGEQGLFDREAKGTLFEKFILELKISLSPGKDGQFVQYSFFSKFDPKKVTHN